MKPNHKYEWTIVLAGDPDHTSINTFIGTVDGALAWADEHEDEVSFDVAYITLTRGNRARNA